MAVIERETMALAVTACLLASVVLADVQAKPAADANGAGPILLRSGFEEGLNGWTQLGSAEFAANEQDRHGGSQSARITVPAATKPQY